MLLKEKFLKFLGIIIVIIEIQKVIIEIQTSFFEIQTLIICGIQNYSFLCEN